MLTPQVPGGMGLGTEIDAAAGCLRFGHTGGNVGYVCFSFAWQAAGVAVAAMANSEGADEVLGSIVAAAERRYAQPIQPAEAARPDDITGRYLLREDYPVDIAADGRRLTFAAGGQQPAELLTLPGGRYTLAGLDCQITFEENDGLPIMHIRQQTTVQTARRTP
jgi:hypothetical protein